MGVASVNITPPLGLEISGFSFGLSRGILDELYAKILLLESGNETIVLITTDLIGFDFDYIDRIRDGIKREIGVSKDHILLSASHTGKKCSINLQNYQKVTLYCLKGKEGRSTN